MKYQNNKNYAIINVIHDASVVCRIQNDRAFSYLLNKLVFDTYYARGYWKLEVSPFYKQIETGKPINLIDNSPVTGKWQAPETDLDATEYQLTRLKQSPTSGAIAATVMKDNDLSLHKWTFNFDAIYLVRNNELVLRCKTTTIGANIWCSVRIPYKTSIKYVEW